MIILLYTIKIRFNELYEVNIIGDMLHEEQKYQGVTSHVPVYI